LKTESVLRIFRLAVVNEEILLGSIGEISLDRLKELKIKLPSGLRHSQALYQLCINPSLTEKRFFLFSI
jgi:hypothetical protein